MIARRRVKQTTSPKRQSTIDVKPLRDEASCFDLGPWMVLRSATGRADTGSHMNKWLRSPESQLTKSVA